MIRMLIDAATVQTGDYLAPRCVRRGEVRHATLARQGTPGNRCCRGKGR